MSLLKGLVVVGLAGSAFAPGCAEPGVRPIVGPDGSAMLHVHCGGDQAACFQLAGSACPRGYDMSPVFDVSQGNFLVRCRDGAAHVATSAEPNAWHASNDGMPPRTAPSPVTSRELPPTSRTASGEVDLGY